MSGRKPNLGFLYPGYAAEDDYGRMAGILVPPVAVELVHTSVGEDAHRIDALLDLGSTARLVEGARLLPANLDAVVWACTSGSFVFGPDGAREQVDAIAAATGAPASSTSFAFVNAAQALGISRVAIAATYPDDVAQAFARFLDSAGIETVSMGSEGIVTAEEVGTFGRERVLAIVTAARETDVEAILVPDTALHTVAWIEEMEAAAGRPVLTANQVTMFEALRLCGGLSPQDGLGTLFRQLVPDPARKG